MPKNAEAYEFVKKAGLIPPHDVDAVEAIYPGSFDEAFDAHLSKFAHAADKQQAGVHFASMIAADLWQKRGGAQVSETIDAHVRAAVGAAEGFLAVTEARRLEADAKKAEQPPTSDDAKAEGST